MPSVQSVPRLSKISLPSWVFGGVPDDLLKEAALRGHYDKRADQWSVQTQEQYLHTGPDLVRLIELDTSGRPGTFSNDAGLLALIAAEPPIETRSNLPAYLASVRGRLEPRVKSNEIEAIFHAFQVDLSTAAAADVSDLIQAIAQSIGNLSIDGTTLERPPALIVHNMKPLNFRMKLPSILLRIEQDDRMRSGDRSDIAALAQSGELIFRASSGMSDGTLLMDAYIAPLLGAASPFVWALAAPRTLGMSIFPLSIALNGWYSEPRHLMDTILRRGSGPSPQRPAWTMEGAASAVRWWVSRLNLLFGWLSDPVVFTNNKGEYLPGAHLQYVLTVEQIFSKVGAILRERDPIAARSLLFGVLDAVEARLMGRPIEWMASIKHSSETAERLQGDIPAEAHSILLPSASRAVGSLEDLAKGFFLTQDPVETSGEPKGRLSLRLGDGTTIPKTAFESVTTYVALLRNSTHGFGAKLKARGSKESDALLAHHDGNIPFDLSLLAYLYLLDVMSRPDDVRRFVSRRMQAIQ